MSNHISLADGFSVNAIRGLAGSFHLLHDAGQRKAVLIDTGLVGEVGGSPSLGTRLRRRLATILFENGLAWHDIEAILLTHGHLDHTGNLHRLKTLTGAPVFAHPAEQAHIDGTFPYRGPSRVCGAMEAFGRFALRYRPVRIDQELMPAMELPFWGGLHVIHLPGHTAGHCGFLSERFDLLFSGDLFASYGFSTHLPPPFLNSCPEKISASLQAVQRLAPQGMIPNHYDRLDPALHRRRFDELVRKIRR